LGDQLNGEKGGYGLEKSFEHPIRTEKRRLIVTLRDAADYITALPRSVSNQDHWQVAMHCLIEAAEDRAPLMFARIECCEL